MGERTEAVFGFVRRIVCLILGVFIICNGLFTENDTTFAIVAGAFFVGVLPVDYLIGSWARHRGNPPPPEGPTP